MSTETIISLAIASGSFLVSIISLSVSIYIATESVRHKRRTKKQPWDLIARPFPQYRNTPSAALLADIKGINLNPEIFTDKTNNIVDRTFEKGTMGYISEDIEDGGLYYGINIKPEYSPYAVRAELITNKWFDRIYITNQGQRKHKQWKKYHIKRMDA